jgi:hypothetical protein
MITGSMARFPPPPDPGPKPVMWKSLGVIAQTQVGFVEAAYELATFRGDLDVDSEEEVRAAVVTLLHALSSGSPREVRSDDVFVLQRRRGLLKVRIMGGFWGQSTTIEGVM